MISRLEAMIVEAALARLFDGYSTAVKDALVSVTANRDEPASDAITERLRRYKDAVRAAPAKPYRPSGPEWSAKMSRVMKKWHADRKKKRQSDHTVDAMRLAVKMKKRRLSPEGRAAIIAGTKAYWKRKKAGKRAAR